jgi:hypothetical protein
LSYEQMHPTLVGWSSFETQKELKHHTSNW